MKIFESEESQKIKEIFEKIQNHPLSLKVKEEEDLRTLDIRKQAAQKIAALRKEEEEQIPKFEAGVREKEEEFAKAKDQLKIAQDDLTTARAELSRKRLDYSQEIAEQEKILLNSYDPMIDEAITWFRDRRETLFRQKPDEQTRKTGSNVFREVKEYAILSNTPQIINALSYCLNSIRELERMRLMAILDVNRIDQLKRNIPDTGEMTEFKAEKSFPKINADPRSLLKSDSELNWLIAKHTEEFNKLMARPSMPNKQKELKNAGKNPLYERR